MQLSKEQVEAFLPHRDPFLFIDTVSKIEMPGDESELITVTSIKELVGGAVIAHFHVNKELDVFRGHFPNRPVLPGVIQVEMMAQASCMLIARSVEDLNNPNLEVALMGVSNAKFRHPVGPGEDLTIHSNCQKVRGPVMSYEAKIFSQEKLVSEAVILASVRFTK
jgi:3-hydroxyacyl-[acyl-carrier-protein] dehydratase